MEILLKEMEWFAELHHVPILQSGGRDILLKTIRKKRPRRVLEIGTAIGFSTLLIALHSAPDVKITTIELETMRLETAKTFLKRSPFWNCLEFCHGDASSILETLAGPFDFIFIDAAKGQYPVYWEKTVPLLSENGIIAADNVLFRGYVQSETRPPRRYKTIVKRLKHYLELAENHPEFETLVYPDGDGLAISYHRGIACEKA